MALIIYYIVKVLKKFDDYKILTHQIYPIIEEHINLYTSNLEKGLEGDEEAVVRLYRAKLEIDYIIQRYDYVHKIMDPIDKLFPEKKLNELLTNNVHFAKNYVSLTAFNFRCEQETID